VMYKSLGKGGKVMAHQISYQVLGVFDMENVLPHIAVDETERAKIIDYVVNDTDGDLVMLTKDHIIPRTRGEVTTQVISRRYVAFAMRKARPPSHSGGTSRFDSRFR